VGGCLLVRGEGLGGGWGCLGRGVWLLCWGEVWGVCFIFGGGGLGGVGVLGVRCWGLLGFMVCVGLDFCGYRGGGLGLGLGGVGNVLLLISQILLGNGYEQGERRSATSQGEKRMINGKEKLGVNLSGPPQCIHSDRRGGKINVNGRKGISCCERLTQSQTEGTADSAN